MEPLKNSRTAHWALFTFTGKAQRDWTADHAYEEMHVDAQDTVLCVDGYLYSGERIIIMNILYPIIYEHKCVEIRAWWGMPLLLLGLEI